MRRASKFVFMLVAATSLVACGGSKSKKGGGDKPAIDQLKGIPGDLDAETQKVMSPINSVDEILKGLAEMPEKAKLSKEDFSALIADSLAGKPFKAPGGMDAKAAGEVESFLGNLTGFKDGLFNAPDNAAGLIKAVAVASAKVPVLAGKVKAESKFTANNPFASKKEKAAAKTADGEVDTVQADVLKQIDGTKKQVTELPGRATAAIAKFVAGAGNLGLTDAALGALTGKVDDVKKGK
jgi:hypothetical protein